MPIDVISYFESELKENPLVYFAGSHIADLGKGLREINRCAYAIAPKIPLYSAMELNQFMRKIKLGSRENIDIKYMDASEGENTLVVGYMSHRRKIGEISYLAKTINRLSDKGLSSRFGKNPKKSGEKKTLDSYLELFVAVFPDSEIANNGLQNRQLRDVMEGRGSKIRIDYLTGNLSKAERKKIEGFGEDPNNLSASPLLWA